jgi:hypothetical protein
VGESVWNAAVGTDDYGDRGAYQAAVMEQYKLYVEMADRVSHRRSFTNTFFLSLNTAVLAFVGVTWRERQPGLPIVPAIVLVGVLGECLVWYYLIRSYWLLNSAKYAVIGDLEQRLPASPYWNGERSLLRERRHNRRYFSLTHVEQWMPFVFAASYLAGFVALALSS